MSEIVNKIDRLLASIEEGNKPSKDDALYIIELLSSEASEDKILLLQSKYLIDEYWHLDRRRIKENFYFVLNYFNILKDKKFSLEYRKTITKKIEGVLVKEKFKSIHKQTILELLGED